MRIILNIGSNRTFWDGWDINKALRFVITRCKIPAPFQVRVDISTPHPTLVIQCDWDTRYNLQSLDFLAAELKQDCVAVYKVDLGYGVLLGPRHESWAPFDLSKFLME